MERDSDSSERPVYWYRQDFPNPLRRRLFEAHSEFVRQTMRINQDLSLSRVVTVAFGSPGRIGTCRIPDPEARSARFRQLCNLFIREVSESWADHLVERVGLRGEKAIKEFEKRAQEFVREAFENNWRMGYAAGEHDKLFWSMAIEVVASKTAELRSLWPKRGRPPGPQVAEATREIRRGRIEKEVLSPALVKRAEALLTHGFTRETLAGECDVDEQTLRKALRSEAVTRSRAERIKRGISTAAQANSSSRR